MRILVLGITGMLGHAVAKILSDQNWELITTQRANENSRNSVYFDAERDKIESLTDELGSLNYVVNCIGVIKPFINDHNSSEVARAIKINSIFPNQLNMDAATKGYKVIQIATDCVFSGKEGSYLETSAHDAMDVYGKTKSLGEIHSENFMNLRCSIIGPEVKRSASLWEWVKNQPPNAKINGFSNHLWNGVTTKAFAQVVKGIIEDQIFKAGVHHLLPSNIVTKYELVSEIALKAKREDIQIAKVEAPISLDRTLKSVDLKFNGQIWKSAGFHNGAPEIQQLISEVN